jgi:hypothetical protein
MMDIRIQDPRIKENIEQAILYYDVRRSEGKEPGAFEIKEFWSNFKRDNGQEACDELIRFYEQRLKDGVVPEIVSHDPFNDEFNDEYYD